MTLTAERLREVLHYDPDTGEFTWRVSRGKGRRGWRAGYIHKYWGYRHIKIGQEGYRAGRLAFLYMVGRWPNEVVDHKDRNKQNDSWGNLREATSGQNNANTVRHFGERFYRGVGWNPRAKKWQVRLGVDGRKLSLGYFTSEKVAAKAYDRAAIEHYGEFATLNFPQRRAAQ